WDPSLALVMGGALAVFLPGYHILRRMRKAPVCETSFQVPGKGKIDRKLVIGATVFGLGWGLVGYCPGPAIAALSSGSAGTAVFVLTMILGWAISRRFS
ncbi:MAG: YeeE/YedE family protein, partial [Idiomarina sp.]|nr:YeeE/YedE family protein [Idiomarina sp.]